MATKNSFEARDFGFDDLSKGFDDFARKMAEKEKVEAALRGFTGGKDPVLDRAIDQVEQGIVVATKNIYGAGSPEDGSAGIQDSIMHSELEALREIEDYLKNPNAGRLDISRFAKDLAPEELGVISVERDPRNIGIVGKVTPEIAVKALEGLGKHSISPNEIEVIVGLIPPKILENPKTAEMAVEKAGAQALPVLAKVNAALAEKSLDLAAKMNLPEQDRLRIIGSMPKEIIRDPKVMEKAVDQVDPRRILRDTPHGKNANTAIEIAKKSPLALTMTLRGISELMDKKGASHEQKQAIFNSEFRKKDDLSSGIPELKKIAMDCVKENPAGYPSLIKNSDALKGDRDLANEAVKGSWKNLPSVDPGVRKLLPPMTIEKAMMGAVQNQNPAFADDQRRALRVGIVAKGFDTQKPAFQEALSSNPSLKPMVEAFADERRQLKAGLAAKAAQAPSQAPSQTEPPARKMESTGRFSSPPKIDRQDEEVKVQTQTRGMKMR